MEYKTRKKYQIISIKFINNKNYDDINAFIYRDYIKRTITYNKLPLQIILIKNIDDSPSTSLINHLKIIKNNSDYCFENNLIIKFKQQSGLLIKRYGINF